MFTRRTLERHNRGRIARIPGASMIYPTEVDPSNLVLWLRADQGVTLDNASVNALTAWTLTLLTRASGLADPDGGTGASRFTESNDGAPATHIAAGTVTNGVTGPTIQDIYFFPETIGIIAIQSAATGNSLYYTAATQTFSNITGNLTGEVRSVAGGWHLLRIRTTDPGANVPAFVVYPSISAGSATYQGNGTKTFQLYAPIETQNRVSQWNDQSGLGNNATQATAGTQPLVRCYDAAGNWVPSGQGAKCEIGWPLDASKNMTFPAAVKTAFTGNGVPMTMLDLRRVLGVPATNNLGGFYLSTPVNGTQILNNYNTPARLVTLHTDDASLQKTQSSTSAYSTSAYTSLAFTYDGVSGSIFQDGVADASNPTNLDVATESPANAFIASMFAMRREVIIYKSVLSAANRLRVENGMLARAGRSLL